MDVKTRKNRATAMYLAGMSILDICEELGSPRVVIVNDLHEAGVYELHRSGLYRDLGECFTSDDVLMYRMNHPVGSKVVDQDGKTHEIKQAFANYCKVEDRSFTWTELARVEWRKKHGKNPRTEWS